MVGWLPKAGKGRTKNVNVNEERKRLSTSDGQPEKTNGVAHTKVTHQNKQKNK